MKKIINITLATLIFILGAKSVSAQSDNWKNKTKSTLEKIFELSKKGDYKTAADYFVNTSSDPAKKYNVTYNFTNRKEKSKVKRNCKKIKAYLDLSDSFEYAGFQKKKIDGIERYIVNVKFKSGNQALNISFNFIKLNGKFVLADFG